MKINFSSQIIGSKNAQNRMQTIGTDKNFLEHHKINTNTQIFNEPAANSNACGFVAFRGNIDGAAKKGIKELSNTSIAAKIAAPFKKLGKSIEGKLLNCVKKEGFNKAAGYVLEHEAMFSALVSLGLVSTIRPFVSLAMPVADDKDKVAIAAKDFVSGIVGYVLASLILKPINVGVIKVTKNPAKYIKNDADLVKKITKDADYKEAFKSFWKNIPDAIVAPTKGVVTVALMPFVISAIDHLRRNKKPAVKTDINTASRLNENCKKAYKESVFANITGGTK